MYTPRVLQYILQVYCYYVEVYLVIYKDLQIKLPAVYMQGTLKAAVYGILNWQYILQVHCIDGNIPSVYTAAY